MSRRPIEHTRREITIKWPPTVGPEGNHEPARMVCDTCDPRHPDFRRPSFGLLPGSDTSVSWPPSY
jgi:hypothetical protein